MIKERLQKAGTSQAELAEKTSGAAKRVCAVERRQRRVSILEFL
jgi:hypothetical protein